MREEKKTVEVSGKEARQEGGVSKKLSGARHNTASVFYAHSSSFLLFLNALKLSSYIVFPIPVILVRHANFLITI